MNFLLQKLKKLSTGKKIFYSVVLLLFIIVIWQINLISYGISQAKGQLNIVYNARPVDEVLNEASFPEEMKQKLLLIKEIRQFAFDSLGLKYSENYTTLFNQNDKPILWTVTASEPFELKAKEWKFPILGSFSYKGFFDLGKAKREANILKSEGYDTSIDEVGGWSTLGWFKDPILSNMLDRDPGRLANLIIHELTHGTLYVKNDVNFNENLASFVGDKGALIFLRNKYGEDSKEYKEYNESKIIAEKYTNLVLKSSERLDSLYKSFDNNTRKNEKLKLKKELMTKIASDLNFFFSYYKGKNSKYREDPDLLNNTYFLDLKRYREKQDYFENEFKEKFNSDFKTYLAYLVKKYPSL